MDQDTEVRIAVNNAVGKVKHDVTTTLEHELAQIRGWLDRPEPRVDVVLERLHILDELVARNR